MEFLIWLGIELLLTVLFIFALALDNRKYSKIVKKKRLPKPKDKYNHEIKFKWPDDLPHHDL